jgi:hypothetical protein
VVDDQLTVAGSDGQLVLHEVRSSDLFLWIFRALNSFQFEVAFLVLGRDCQTRGTLLHSAQWIIHQCPLDLADSVLLLTDALPSGH